jgi:nitrogen PTS system EIIA component
MHIQPLLSLNRTACGLEANSKKQALEILAKTIAQDIPALDAAELFRHFLSRERLGSTGIGHGIAIPHCRIAQNIKLSTPASESINESIGALITLKQPVEFDAIDAEPVDILFAILVPEAAHNEHLQHLATLANALINDHFRQQLRAATSNTMLYDVAINSSNQRTSAVTS